MECSRGKSEELWPTCLPLCDFYSVLTEQKTERQTDRQTGRQMLIQAEMETEIGREKKGKADREGGKS